LQNPLTHEWQHPLSDVVNSLVGSGLRIEFLHESPFCGWQRFPFMVKGEEAVAARRQSVNPAHLLDKSGGKPIGRPGTIKR
jgi:hypothetical protein